MKKFLVIGNFNAVQYKEFFSSIKDDKVWLGISKRGMDFITSEGLKMPINAVWFTSLDNDKRHIKLNLNKSYNSVDYPKYDNYDVIEVSRTCDIPYDYDGVMGVPLTYLDKYNPEQFEIIGIACGNSWANYPDTLRELGFNPDMKYGGGLGTVILNGKALYTRLFIRLKEKHN